MIPLHEKEKDEEFSFATHCMPVSPFLWRRKEE
jgi:hypothetical protein